ncbi:MAG TPA: plastocyanin/azurin family copper-binding protein [Kofleriaceae bacterium]
MTRLVLAGLLLAACGGDDGGGGGTADAPMVDASANKVVGVTCPSTPDAEITISSGGGAYMPMATMVPVNAVVRFTMTATHDAKPNTLTTTDPGLVVGFGETKCLKFTATGTFGFFCSAHSFAGTVTVN